MAIQAQLYGGSPELFDNGCGGGGVNVNVNPFSFDFQQEKLQQFQQLQHQQQLMLYLQSQQQQRRNESLFLKNTNTSQEIKRFMENQKQEIDNYIRSQNEKLGFLLQEQRKQQIGLLTRKIESKALILLRQKDEEIARATNRTMELQNLLNNLEMENQAWQRVAQENEAMVESLNSTLEQLKERVSCMFNNDAEDAESCCEKGEEEEIEEHRKQSMVCKFCNSRNSCVLLLPCRHLCSCKECAVSLESCPVCGTDKKESIEALFSWEDDVSGKIICHQNKKRKFDDRCNGVGDELELQQFQFVL